MKRISFAIVLCGLAFSLNAFCSDAQPGIEAAYDSNTDVLNSLQSGDIRPAAQQGVNAAVAQGIENLRAAGELTLATQLETEWNQLFAQAIILQPLDLYDHAPMSQWLANFYLTLFNKTKGMIGAIQLANDINVLNFALPIVLHPHGSWRTGNPADRIEYRKHFIPFANITTYWASYVGCRYAAKKYAAQSGLERYCGDAAGELEHYMGRYAAPKISDWIFEKANAHDPAELDAPAIQPVQSKSDFVALIEEMLLAD